MTDEKIKISKPFFESEVVLLKDKKEEREEVKNIVNSNILNELDNMDYTEALLLVDWLYKKAQYSRAFLSGKRMNGVPNDIKRGDIILCEFGYNIGDELSDKEKHKHFALVWARVWFLLIVIPLTSKPKSCDFAVNLGKIEILPEDSDSWAKLDDIRSISIRRVSWMEQCEEGKLYMGDNEILMKKVESKIKEKFLLNID